MHVISLKPATKADLNSLIEIERSVSGTKTFHAITDQDVFIKEFGEDFIYLICAGAKVIGSVMYRTVSLQTVYVSGLAIIPPFQSRGIGKSTMALLLNKLKGVTRFEVVTHPENVRAVKLYRSFGFTEKSRLENYFGDGEPSILFVKNL